MDGGTPVQQTFNGNLTNNQSTTMLFPATSLNPGSSVVSYNIVSVNGTTGWLSPAAVSIEDQVFSKLNTTALSGGVAEGMENGVLLPNSGFTRDISTAIFDSTSNLDVPYFSIMDGPAFNLGMVGGFGSSNRSMLFRFYDIANGEKLSLVMQKVNLGTGSQLTFNHAHQRYGGSSNDRLEVFVSSDCGATWTSVFNKAGAALSNAGTMNAFFIPTSATWTANTVDLTAYNNVSDLIVKFEGTSNYGNNLYLDDIAVTSTLSNDEVISQGSIKLYPNPSSDFIKVSGLTNTSDYVIYNLLGVKVAEGKLSNNENLDIRNLSSGLFILEIDGLKASKFVKQ